MGLELATAWVRIHADATALPNELSRVKSVVQGLLGSLGVGVGLYGLINEAMATMAHAQAKITAEKRMDATWNATANAIGKTQAELKEMVKQWERVTDFDGAAITNALASMLTYTALNAEELEKVMSTAMDITAVFGGDLRQNAEQVARILSNPLDPHTGLGSLSRKGYYITPAQRAEMKAFQKAGNEAGAKGVIMQVLSGQEGAARRMAAPLDALKEMKLRVADLADELGAKLLQISKKWQETTLPIKESFYNLANAVVPVVEYLMALNTQWEGMPLKITMAATAIVGLILALRGVNIALGLLKLSAGNLLLIAAALVIFTAWESVAVSVRDLAASYDTLAKSMQRAHTAQLDMVGGMDQASYDNVLKSLRMQIDAADKDINTFSKKIRELEDSMAVPITAFFLPGVKESLANAEKLQKSLTEQYKKVEAARAKGPKAPGAKPGTNTPTGAGTFAGRFGFLEFGDKIQDVLLGADDVAHQQLQVQKDILVALESQDTGTPPAPAKSTVPAPVLP